jgi:hypothetical protein
MLFAKTNRPLPILSKLAVIVFLLLACSPARAEKEPSTAPASPSGPQVVYVGMYINDLYELDLKQSTYVVDFYIWFRWTGDIDPTDFEFMNGELDLKEHPYRITDHGINYISYHCRGTFHIVFDFRRYPLDSHKLIIEIEDGVHDAKQLVYAIDSDNMHRLRPVVLSGWTCANPEFSILDHVYATNFGEPTVAQDKTSSYSRLNCAIDITRSGDFIYIKTFLGLFISVGIAFLSFLLRPNDTDPRFAVGVAAIFGAVSSEIVASGNLPDMPYLTMGDKIHLFSLFMIFLSLLQSVLLLKLYRVEKHSIAFRINRLSLFAFPIFYAGVVAILTFIG